MPIISLYPKKSSVKGKLNTNTLFGMHLKARPLPVGGWGVPEIR